MNAKPTTPDSLDLLFAALVRVVREKRPELLAGGLDVADVLRAVPYKAVRKEIGAATDDDYGHVMTRLLSGERGLLFVDDLMQDDLRAELDSRNPDLQAYRSYINSRVTLAQEHVRAVLDALGPAAPREVVAAPEPVARGAPAKPAAATVATVATVARPQAAKPIPEPVSAPRPSPPRERPMAKPRAVPNAIALMAGGVEAKSARPGCKYCGQPLPHGRDIRFCPHCGQDLSVMRCAACSAELEPGWKFCVACGRAATH